MADIHKPGEIVKTFGIYKVVGVHDGAGTFEVTCIEGEPLSADAQWQGCTLRARARRDPFSQARGAGQSRLSLPPNLKRQLPDAFPHAWSPAMVMDLEGIKAGFAALLRDRPRGTTADVTEHTVVYWDGEQVMGVHLCADHPGFDQRFELDHHFCGDAHEHMVSWFAHPRFTVRSDLVAWLDRWSSDSHSGD
jgi:hypothetical protein